MAERRNDKVSCPSDEYCSDDYFSEGIQGMNDIYDVNSTDLADSNQGVQVDTLTTQRRTFDYGSERTILDILEDFTLDDFLDDQLTVGQINLRKFINKILKRYTEQVKTDLKGLGFDSTVMELKLFEINAKKVKIIKKFISNFDMLYLTSTEGKVKYQWWGYTYKLIDNVMNDYQIGYSTLPRDKRFNYYLREMFFNPKCRFYVSGQETIYNRMFEFLRSHGLKNFTKPNSNLPDFEKIKKFIQKRFDFVITGVYFSEYATKKSEDDQILAAEKDGTAMNVYRGGGGSKSVNEALRFFITYISLGYSLVVITEKLQKNHGFNLKFNKVYSHIDLFFGGIYKAREVFLDPLFDELKLNGYSEVDIYRNFKHYFDGKITRREFEDIDKLIYLTNKGFSRNYIASYFKMSLGTFDLRIKEFIAEYFPFLEIYIDKENKDSPTFWDLKHYLLAHEVLNLIITSKGRISKDKIVTKLKNNCKDDPDFSLHPRHQLLSVIKNIFEMDFETLTYYVKAKFLYDIIIKKNPKTIRELYNLSMGKDSTDHYRFNPIANVLRRVFIPSNSKNSHLLQIKANDLHKSDVIEIFNLAKIAIIAELLENGFRLGYSTSQIAESSPMFKSKDEVEFYSNKIFRGIPDIENFCFEEYLCEKFGVRKFEFPYI